MKRELTCTNYFIILGKRFLREHTKKPNANVQARPDVTFWNVEYHSLLSPIYDVKYENTFTCKRISLDSGGMMF